jgi:AcrR family transcriptional regulator
VTSERSAGHQALLDRVVEHMLTTGSATTSLRALAGEIGSSHRMLIYHFGGQEGLVHAVVEEVEARQRAALIELAADADATPAELSLAFWERLSSPELREVERLFFQLYTRLLDLGQTDAAARLTTEWLQPSVDQMVARGYPRAEAQRITRLGIAVYRGLLLDLLATGDKRAVDAAVRKYVEAVFGD